MTIRSILFPVFNWGQAILLCLLMLLLALIAILSDPLLALYMGVGAYLGIVMYSLLRGLAPDEAEIREDEIVPISALLATQPLVSSISDRVWAPAGARSWLFKSDWISIEETGAGEFVLKARKRDLKIILSEIRPRKI